MRFPLQSMHRNFRVHRLLNDLRIRLLAQDDSLDALTALLHRAFAPLGSMGLACDAVAQSAATTAARTRRGACFVALRGARIVGTVTTEMPALTQACPRYRRPGTMSLHQFAIEPDEQRRGWGTQLLRVAQRWAALRDCSELALDTPRRASHLLRWYQAQGFRPVDEFQHPGKRYRSVVLSKPIEGDSTPDRAWACPHRTFADRPGDTP